MANPNTAPRYNAAVDYVGAMLPAPETTPTVAPPFPTPEAWVAHPVLLPNGQIDPTHPARVPRVLDAPTVFQPTPEAPKTFQPITLHQDRRPSESVILASVANQDPTLTGVSWSDAKGNSYRVRDFRQEDREGEEFYVDKGVYNKAAMGVQRVINHAHLPMPAIVTPNASLRGFQLHGGPGIQAIGLAKMRHDREFTGYRTLDIYDAEGGLKEMKTFRSTAELQAYIDANTVHPHGYVDNVAERRHQIYGHNWHGGHDYLDQAPVALGFQEFKLGDAEPPRKPKTDFIPHHEAPTVPISVIEAINQGKRLGLGSEGGDALVGFTWNNGNQEQTIVRSVMTRKSGQAREYTGESTLEQAVVIETTYVTPAHTNPKDRDRRPGGSVQKRQIVMTLSELQTHFDSMAKEQAAASHGHGSHGQSGRQPKPTNAHFALPELEPSDILHRTLRQQEMIMLYRQNRLGNDPQFQATLGRLALMPYVARPNRQPGTPLMTYRRALTLMSRYDKDGWEDRAKGLWQTYGKDNPDARGLMKTINAVGEGAAAVSAKGVLTDIHKTLDRMGLQAAADERISMSDILVVMSRRREEHLRNRTADRADGLTNADPFAYTEAGLRARREIAEMFIADTFNQATLVAVADPDPAKAGQIAGYVRSRIITDHMPKDLADWILDTVNRVGPQNNTQLSPGELVSVGEALTNYWINPTAYDKFDRGRFMQRQLAQRGRRTMPVAA